MGQVGQERGATTSLSDKRVLVTGGTTGIGRATVTLLARNGARVLTLGRHQPELDAALEEARATGTPVEGLTADLARKEDVEAVYRAVDEKLGGIDMLVACAAVGAQPLHEMAEDDWRYVIETNLIGTLAVARQAILRMDAQGGGSILFIGSISAEIKAVGESVYAATKAGVHAFAETARKELAEKHIRVSVIEPGSVATPMQECSDEEKEEALRQQEMLHAEEVAEAILFALTRSAGADVVRLRIEPLIQKTS